MSLKVTTLKKDSFEPFGKILGAGETPDGEEKDWKFYVLVREPDSPWRIGYYVPKIKKLAKLERHDSMESFEPVTGFCLLVVAGPDKPDEPVVFVLDKPVVLYKKIWHGILSLSDVVEIKITENLEVGTEFHRFRKPLEFRVIGGNQ